MIDKASENGAAIDEQRRLLTNLFELFKDLNAEMSPQAFAEFARACNVHKKEGVVAEFVSDSNVLPLQLHLYLCTFFDRNLRAHHLRCLKPHAKL
jgi:hypothetical protein